MYFYTQRLNFTRSVRLLIYLEFLRIVLKQFKMPKVVGKAGGGEEK